MSLASSCADLARIQCGAAESSAQWNRERLDLTKQVSDLGAAVAVARLIPQGASSDVPVAVQHRLDSAISAIESLQVSVRDRDESIRQFQAALYDSQSTCAQHVKYKNDFALFVKDREEAFKAKTVRLEQALFMSEEGRWRRRVCRRGWGTPRRCSGSVGFCHGAARCAP